MTPERIAELELADAEGRLVILPCAIDATVYTLYAHEMRSIKNKGKYKYEIIERPCWVFQVDSAGVSGPGGIDADEFVEYRGFDGKYYLTREDAEKALKEAQS